MHETNVASPRPCVYALCQNKGFETFNPDRGALHCDRPGTGTVDAPRSSSIKLPGVLIGLGIKARALGPEAWFLHTPAGELAMLMTERVGDLKAAGPGNDIVRVLSCFQQAFGDIKLNRGTSHES